MKYAKTKQILNQAVADLSALSVQIHQIHWYMRGNDFISLHPKMDEYMGQVEVQLDEISERLITLDGSPYSTLKEFAEHTKIQETSGVWGISTQERFKSLVKSLRYMTELYQKGIETTDEEGDAVTNGIFTEAKGDFEKLIWILQAELGLAPGIDA
ncbi:MAG: DNA starvation/stationary phase protection protein [Streptococcaceae bacterium]|jgi:starvation-inducible DNA-binding protein|nr:DNA starvation/stationary phase protection protein [Streptococcaceae bacterium]